MKTLPLFIFLMITASISAQNRDTAEFYNQSDTEITVFYNERAVIVPANRTVAFPEAPKTSFIAYIYKEMKGVGESTKCFQKIGFVRLKNDKGLIIYDDFLKPLPVYLKNVRPTDISVEYFDKVIFIPKGVSRMLPDAYISSDLTVLFTVSEIIEGRLGKSFPVTISFQITNDAISGEIR